MEATAAVSVEAEGLLRALPGRCRAKAFASDGSVRWTFGDWSSVDNAAAAATAATAAAVEPRGDGAAVSVHALPHARTLYRAAAGADGAGALIVVADGGPNDDLAAGVEALASLLATIVRLNDELDAMAVELADRYEELNLVYATSRPSAPAHDVKAGLEDLVRHCHEHLGSSVAALVLPRQRVTIERHGARAPLRDVAEFLRAAAGPFFDELARAGRPVVCNEDQSDAGPLAGFGPFKMAAMPVRNGRDAVCGVLMIVNGRDAPDFRNSDKNLLASIAEKAAKLIERGFDALTGLPSRWELTQRIDALLARDRESGAEHALLWIDVDELRVLNETLGTSAGDAVLKTVARHLEAQQRLGRLLGRLDGDDFALVLENCPISSARATAETLCESMRKLPLTFDGQPVAITVSIGVAAMDRDSESAAAVLHAAELASTAAHEGGRDRIHVYQENADTVVQRGEQMRWVGRIHNALRNDRFRLFGQLIQPLSGRAEQHVEVLLRLIDDHDVLQPPGSFLPAAERFFLMPAIDRWVFTHALALMRTREPHELPICSINLSGQSISDESFVDFILAELAGSAALCRRICFEITETAAIKSMEAAKQFMLQVKRRGCHFSLDDFGTGLSSFSYLKALPFDFVKIDGSFVTGILEDRVSESMVRAITEVGHAMGLGIIAEYVENAAVRDKLKRIEVDFGQGYAIERPIPLAEHFARRGRSVAVNA